MANEVNIVVKTKGTKQAKKAFKEVDKSTQTLKKAALGLGAAIGIRQLGRQMFSAVDRAEEMSSAYAITEQIVKQTGGTANLTAKEIKNLSREQSLLTGVDKALVTEGNNVLLTFKNLRDEVGAGNDVFTRTSASMLDMAAVMGTDAKSAAVQLGKALNDPIANLGALGRAGVQFTDQQKEQIKTMVASGDLLGAQRIILDELESQFGGTAAASADATDKIANGFKEVQEAIGSALLPLVEGFVPTAVNMGIAIPGALRNIGIAIDTTKRKFGDFTDVVDIGLGPWINFTDAWTDQEEVIFLVTRRMGDYEASVLNNIDEMKVFAGTFLTMKDNGDLAVGTLRELIAQSDISNEKLQEAIELLLANADLYGLTAQEIAQLQAQLRVLVQVEGEATVATEDFGDEVATTGKRLRGVTKSLMATREAVRRLVDPVFNAERATDAFNETLKEVQEDGKVTQQEIEELTEAYGNMQGATDALSPENVLAYGQQSQEALGFLDESVEVTRGKLDALPGIAFTALESAAAGLSLGIPLTIDVQLTAPSASSLRSALRRELEQMRRRGEFGGGFQL